MDASFKDWVDLSESGMELRLVRVPRGSHYYVVRDTGKDVPEGAGVDGHAEALAQLGFRAMQGKLGLRLKECRFDSLGDPVSPPAVEEFASRIPGVAAMPFAPAEHFIDQTDCVPASGPTYPGEALKILAKDLLATLEKELSVFARPKPGKRGHGIGETVSRRWDRIVAKAAHEIHPDRLGEVLAAAPEATLEAAKATVPAEGGNGPRTVLGAVLHSLGDGMAKAIGERAASAFRGQSTYYVPALDIATARERRIEAEESVKERMGDRYQPPLGGGGFYEEWPNRSALGMKLTLVRTGDDDFRYEVSDIGRKRMPGLGVAEHPSFLHKLGFKLPNLDKANATTAAMRVLASPEGAPSWVPDVHGVRYIARVHGKSNDVIGTGRFDERIHFEDRRTERAKARNPSLPGNPFAGARLPCEVRGYGRIKLDELAWEATPAEEEAAPAPPRP